MNSSPSQPPDEDRRAAGGPPVRALPALCAHGAEEALLPGLAPRLVNAARVVTRLRARAASLLASDAPGAPLFERLYQDVVQGYTAGLLGAEVLARAHSQGESDARLAGDVLDALARFERLAATWLLLTSSARNDTRRFDSRECARAVGELLSTEANVRGVSFRVVLPSRPVRGDFSARVVRAVVYGTLAALRRARRNGTVILRWNHPGRVAWVIRSTGGPSTRVRYDVREAS